MPPDPSPDPTTPPGPGEPISDDMLDLLTREPDLTSHWMPKIRARIDATEAENTRLRAVEDRFHSSRSFARRQPPMPNPTTPLPQGEEEPPDWLAIAQYKYLHEPEFHAYVEYCVQERLRAIAPRPS